jgi:outer membrane immunogenic protein
MKKFLTSAAMTALLGGSAMAADMPIKAPPMLMPSCPNCNWDGFYVGGNVGGSIGHDRTTESVSLFPPGGNAGVTNPVASQSYTQSPSGALGGFQLGWNRQFGSWVWGVEGDWDWSGQQDKSQTQNFIASSVVVAPSTLTYSDEQKISWLATVRGRLGWAQDCFLWYLTGGAAFGEVQSNYNLGVTQLVGAGTFGAAGAAGFNTTKTGWTIGGGVETALPWIGASNRWSAKLEYLYVDLGSVTNAFTTPNAIAGSNFAVSSSSNIHDHIIRVGVNYRFGG